ncbi:CO/xanthine dehydrogenase Mo-binding subunit [Nonomuraea thailandensis]|uniref:CO/xanthine dehydrogenase Mo-binding subunit n=1 Tax=Nonomuraea thailandensis TaxID=1188745 RepID=A0A9X2GIG8_9ACTN|nr:molybdopterin cofactor-binding domain-containing protein [Nonomuraea thailandensis]MCP2358317.1 CO/xanthine dehydrogenase Mo-binding subunit [Nonomuraea thailandensis]
MGERFDAHVKAAGKHRYPSDVALPGMLWVRVVRARHAHATIRAIDTTAARETPGVACVLTASDVPGLNAFGLDVADQPVLASDLIRFHGEAIAIVAADTDQQARRAADAVLVDAEPLEVVSDPLEPADLCGRVELGTGDIDAALADADLVRELTYQTPRQEHAFLETEAGCAYDDDGVLTIVAGGQNPFHDRRQLAAILGVPESRLRVLHPMMGGAFGGKEDLNVQPLLALVTWHTGRPCRMMYDRQESIAAGVKRHSFQVRYRIAATSAGDLVAADVDFVAEAGAYTTLSPAVVGLAAEHACGPYAFAGTRIRGRAAFTNNGNASAFRGFGNPQMVAGLEQCVDMLARDTGLGPIEFRRRNLLRPGEVAGFGRPVLGTLGMGRVLDAAQASPLLTEPIHSETPHKRRGVGLAIAWQGFGMGAGVKDRALVRLERLESGRIRLHVSTPDMGQGNLSAYIRIAADELGVPASLFDIADGDSDGPDSGSSNGSRTMFTVGSAVLQAARELRRTDGGPLSVEGRFAPRQSDPITPGIPHAAFASSAQIVLVEVDTLTGEVDVLRVEHYLDAGRVIDRAGVEAQSEGAIAQGLGLALLEDAIIEDGEPRTTRLSTYLIPSALDVPADIVTFIVEEPEPLSPLGVRGIGEIGISATAAAVANAIYDAVGRRFARFPITPEQVLEALSS